MIAIGERQAFERVRSRLVERFPQVPLETVRRTVQDVHAGFDDRVCDFIPILVEREAHDRLVVLATPASPSPATTI